MAVPTGTARMNRLAEAGVPVTLPNGQTAFAPLFVAADASGNATGGSSGTTPVTGSFTATGNSALFQALPGRAIWVKLSGTFVATVVVQRCSDGTTATAQTITVGGSTYASFTAPCQEAVSSEDDTGVAYRLSCTAFTSGTVNYQLGHK